MTRRAVCALVLGGLLVGSGRADAQTSSSTAAAATGPSPIALIISGGVSLGVYEAGFLYLLTEAVKRHPDLVELSLFTGASAGSANALVSLINACSPPNGSPSKELGWQAWMDVGYKDLFQPEEVTASSIFSREPLKQAMGRIWEVWKKGLPASCDKVIGVAVTRVDKYRVKVNDDMFVPRIEEKFVLRIRGQGPGRPPSIENYVDTSSHMAIPLLALTPEDGTLETSRHNFEQLSSVLYASAAFPIAFAPRKIAHCLTTPSSERDGTATSTSCTEADRADEFVDGGILDNNPLRLASQVAAAGLRTDRSGVLRWRASGDEASDVLHRPTGLRYLYVDPDTMAYPTLDVDRKDDSGGPDGILGLVAKMADDFVTTSRSKELYTIVQENQTLSESMRSSVSNYPKASEELGAFMGFFERELRRFDYYLGMYDAYAQIDRNHPALHFQLKEQISNAEYGHQFDAEWRPFACMLSWYEPGREQLRSACEGEDLRDFRIILQASLDRLYSHCRLLDPAQLALTHRHMHCRLAAEGHAPPEVDGVSRIPANDHWRRPDESTFAHFIRLLESYEFWFKDLDLERDEAQFGRVKIRRKVLKMVTAVADAQPSSADRTVILTAGRTLANQITYEPPKDWAYITVGTSLEAGASILPFDWNRSWARLNLALHVKNFVSLLTQEDVRISFTPAIGPEFQLLPITSTLLQPMVGVRAGYQFAANDVLATKTCTEERARDDKRNCSQFVLHTYLALAIVERIRLQLLVEIFPQSFDFDNASYDFQFGLGVQFF